jgi:IMP dehydrogenase
VSRKEEKMKEALTYDDVLLVPKFSDIESRANISLESELDVSLKFNTPIIASPMDTVSGENMAIKLSQLGGVAVIHRYNTIEQQCEIVRSVKRVGERVGAAVGTTGDFLERVTRLKNAGVDFICIDVAHGHHKMVYDAITKIRAAFPFLHIMAGNVATAEAFEALQSWGADSIRVGIGGGSICSTRIQTGHGVPNVSAIMECAEVATSAKLIADGGIKNAGDIVKALAAGADFVMLGSILAGTDESPGEVIESVLHGTKMKSYRGMASREAQEEWRGKSSAPEGISTMVPYKGPVEFIFNDLVGNIKSGLSYTGAVTISGLQSRSEFIRQTSAGQHESSTHILSKTPFGHR